MAIVFFKCKEGRALLDTVTFIVKILPPHHVLYDNFLNQGGDVLKLRKILEV